MYEKLFQAWKNRQYRTLIPKRRKQDKVSLWFSHFSAGGNFWTLGTWRRNPNRILRPHWNEELLTEVWVYWGSSIFRAEWRKLCREASSRKHSRHFLQSFLNKSFTYIKVNVYKASRSPPESCKLEFRRNFK